MSVLEGVRVLVMEDEFLTALALETALKDLGCVVVGPFASVGEGLPAADGDLDAAVLDVNLRDGLVTPLARRLVARGVPVVLSTGHADPASLDPALAGLPRLSKPCSDACLRRILETLLSAGLERRPGA